MSLSKIGCHYNDFSNLNQKLYLLLNEATSISEKRKIADYKKFDDKINNTHSLICLIRMGQYKENQRTSMYVNYMRPKATRIDMGRKSSIYVEHCS